MKYTELEFVCYNSEYPDGTTKENQYALYRDLKKLNTDVVPFYQDHSDDTHDEYSLTAILVYPSIKNTVVQLARKHHVNIDMINKVDDYYLQRVLDGNFEFQITEKINNFHRYLDILQ